MEQTKYRRTLGSATQNQEEQRLLLLNVKISHSETLRLLGVQHIVQPPAITAVRYGYTAQVWESAPPLSQTEE